MRRYASQAARSVARTKLREVPAIHGKLNDTVTLEQFRKEAFIPEHPWHIKSSREDFSLSTKDSRPAVGQTIPALTKWFSTTSSSTSLNSSYFQPFQETYLPYELTLSCASEDTALNSLAEKILRDYVPNLSLFEPQRKWYSFHAPLSLFLQAPTLRSTGVQLYIAQAQLSDLPQALRDDVPTPRLVMEGGRGDIYDTNIWIGMQPTYTPLHRDPNPNLLVQLASKKKVRLFPPNVGKLIFHNVQKTIGRQGFANLRGEEMMEGLEREALHSAVWENEGVEEGLEALLDEGDALFIPKGWWHSIKSHGLQDNDNGSVNWWFR